eukprot:601494-Pyramimonas_sp.AAC.2
MHKVRPLADVSDLTCPLCSQSFTRRDTLLRHVRLRCSATVEARAQALQIPVDQIPIAARGAQPSAVLRRPAAARSDGDVQRLGRGGSDGGGRQAQKGRGRGGGRGKGRGRARGAAQHEEAGPGDGEVHDAVSGRAAQHRQDRQPRAPVVERRPLREADAQARGGLRKGGKGGKSKGSGRQS